MGVLDSSGKLVKSWETDIPINFSAMGYHAVNIKKVQNSYFEIYVTYKYEEGVRFGFDTSTGKLTHIKNIIL